MLKNYHLHKTFKHFYLILKNYNQHITFKYFYLILKSDVISFFLKASFFYKQELTYPLQLTVLLCCSVGHMFSFQLMANN